MPERNFLPQVTSLCREGLFLAAIRQVLPSFGPLFAFGKQRAMLKAHFDQLLNTILDSHEGIADLFFVVGRPFQVEAHGKLKPVAVTPSVPVLTPFHVERIVNRLVGPRIPGSCTTCSTPARAIVRTRSAPAAACA